MKTSELTGAQLDYLVAKADAVGAVIEADMCWQEDGGGPYYPSTSWAQGGPIIERERIDLEFMDDGGWRASISEWRPGWLTEHLHEAGVAYGPTPLIAAMRAYIASRFGDEV